ncbi:hypothetical protein [[Acholeplasma] multilocale]|uniref:hypothetical protein n=1 Tax=[Acholeplasma] multilocale TaxID=264638 RepID=UPI000478DA76|nr:hypothetical protein [[Acholeplasma] multilocale]
MEIKIKKENRYKTFFKSNFPIMILALTYVVIMAIPFFMESYIPNINANLRLSASEYSFAGAVYGFVSLPCYLLGSYIGDKFKPKQRMYPIGDTKFYLKKSSN